MKKTENGAVRLHHSVTTSNAKHLQKIDFQGKIPKSWQQRQHHILVALKNLIEEILRPLLGNFRAKWWQLAVLGGLTLLLFSRKLHFHLSIHPIGDTGVQHQQPLPSNPTAGGEAAALLPTVEKHDDTRAYIERYKKTAQAEMKLYGIPASITLAQGILESQSGKSGLARKNNNHFGIKCFSKKCKRGHCSNYEDDTHKDFFRKYATAEESYRAHSILLTSPHYAPLLKHGKNYKAWAKGLKTLGYATAKNYDEALIQVIERYELHRCDL